MRNHGSPTVIEYESKADRVGCTEPTLLARE
jgi:hypothetical protein